MIEFKKSYTRSVFATFFSHYSGTVNTKETKGLVLFMVFVCSPVGVWEVAAHAADQQSPEKTVML